MHRSVVPGLWIVMVLAHAWPAAAQVDRARAQGYFQEARALCEREAGRTWGVTLCGPMVFVDAATHTTATNQPAPDAPLPPAFGFANMAMNWGGTRWSAYNWSMLPVADKDARGRLLMHELFHRIQPQLGLLLAEPTNDHLDTLDGRYWLQLEWRALAASLDASGTARSAALADALAFRAARLDRFPDAAENERRLVINEGLAEYTGTVAWASSRSDAAHAAQERARIQAQQATYVRTFAYASGAMYGVLLDDASPGWTRTLTPKDDLALLLMSSSRTQPSRDVDGAAARYDGPALRRAEEKRDADQQVRIADERHRFAEGPVLVVPAGRNASFLTAGITPIPGLGTVYPTYRVSGEWGSLEAERVLLSTDKTTLTLAAPVSTGGPGTDRRRLEGHHGGRLGGASGSARRRAGPGPRHTALAPARRTILPATADARQQSCLHEREVRTQRQGALDGGARLGDVGTIGQQLQHANHASASA